MGSEQMADSLFVGLIVLPAGLFVAGCLMVAFCVFFFLLIGGCLSGTGPWEPTDTQAEVPRDPDSDVP